MSRTALRRAHATEPPEIGPVPFICPLAMKRWIIANCLPLMIVACSSDTKQAKRPVDDSRAGGKKPGHDGYPSDTAVWLERAPLVILIVIINRARPASRRASPHWKAARCGSSASTP